MNLLLLILLGVGVLASVPMIYFKRTTRLGILVALAVVMTTAFFLWQANRYSSGFAQVELGDSKDRVIGLLGHPRSVTDGSTTVYGYPRTEHDPVPAGTVEQIWYYAALLPECWQFSIGADGTVIEKYHWNSP